MGAIRGLFSFFTMLRLDIDEVDMQSMNENFHLVPLIGLFYGLILGVGIFILQQFVEQLLAVATVFFLIQILNRFLHLDGLMDVGDGLTVSGTREDHLRALKDTRIGAGGVAFAFLVTLISFSGLATIPNIWVPFIPLVVEIFSRNAMLAAAAFGNPGTGMAGESVRSTGLVSLIKSIVISLTLAISFSASLWYIFEYYGLSVPDFYISAIALTLILIGSIVIGWFMANTAHKNFGIVNGDVLGATNEIARALLLVLILAVV